MLSLKASLDKKALEQRDKKKEFSKLETLLILLNGM